MPMGSILHSLGTVASQPSGSFLLASEFWSAALGYRRQRSEGRSFLPLKKQSHSGAEPFFERAGRRPSCTSAFPLPQRVARGASAAARGGQLPPQSRAPPATPGSGRPRAAVRRSSVLQRGNAAPARCGGEPPGSPSRRCPPLSQNAASG